MQAAGDRHGGRAGTLLPWMCKAGTNSEDSHLGLSLDVASRDLHFRDGHGDGTSKDVASRYGQSWDEQP